MIIRFYILNGTIIKYAKTSPIQLIAAFYPILYIFISILISIFLIIKLQPFLALFCKNYIISFALSLIISLIVFKTLLNLGEKLAVFWLLEVYIFGVEFVYKENKDLNHRLNLFSNYIVNALKEFEKGKLDEIIIVAHSVGTILIIPLLDKVFNKIKLSKDKKIYILTLGECIPVVSFLPKAKSFLEKMKKIIYNKSLVWIDYTTPIDGACFPLLDFYKYSQIEVENNLKPKYLSPRFHTLYSKKVYKDLKRNRYLTHFIYLLSHEYNKGYNFFKITAGENSFLDNIFKSQNRKD